jgi:hypothetical protein
MSGGGSGEITLSENVSGGNGKNQTTTENNTPASSAALIGWMMDGTYYITYTVDMTYDGHAVTSKGSVAADSDKIATTTEMKVAGQQVKSRVITINGITHIIDDTFQIIMKSPVSLSPDNNGTTDFSKIKYVGKGTGKVKGKTLPYEEYVSEGVTVKYYLDGGEVYAVETGAEGAKIIMVIESYSKTIPPGSFDLPKDYTNLSF